MQGWSMIRLTRVCLELEVDLHRLRIAMEDEGSEAMRRAAENLVFAIHQQVKAFCQQTGLASLQKPSVAASRS
jgi:hypothetical protein